MHCRSCGADLPDHAEYCLRCGERVQLGSVLGVGTDLPPVPQRERPVPPGDPSEEVPEDLSKTAELPRVAGPVAAGATAAPSLTPSPDPVGPVDEEPAKRPGHSRASILAMVATFVVLTLIGTFALTRILGSGDPDPAVTSATSPSASGSAGGSTSESPEPSATAPSTSAPSPSTQSAAPSTGVTIPASARRCSTSGSDAVATAYAGTERTSCEFAAAVREAYRKAGTPDGATTLRAYSPVTKKWYSLSCDGGEPVTCTSTTNAVVLLAP
jgi:hypothetical protein